MIRKQFWVALLVFLGTVVATVATRYAWRRYAAPPLAQLGKIPFQLCEIRGNPQDVGFLLALDDALLAYKVGIPLHGHLASQLGSHGDGNWTVVLLASGRLVVPQPIASAAWTHEDSASGTLTLMAMQPEGDERVAPQLLVKGRSKELRFSHRGPLREDYLSLGDWVWLPSADERRSWLLWVQVPEAEQFGSR